MRISPVIQPVNISQKSLVFRGTTKKDTGDTFVPRSAKKAVKVNYPSTVLQCLSYLPAKKMLNGFEKFSIDEYEKLSGAEKALLRAASSGFCSKRVKALDDLSYVFKSHCDKKYGEGNYVFVSIGRSLEQLGHALKLKGAETKLLPVSSVMKEDLAKFEQRMTQDGIENYHNYLKREGLDSSSVKNSQKHYIFADYCYSGDTMLFVQKMLKDDRFGLNLDNVEFLDFWSFYDNLYEDIPYCFAVTPRKLDTYLALEGFKKFPLTKALPCSKLANVDDIANFEQNLETKLFNFKLIDRIKS